MGVNLSEHDSTTVGNACLCEKEQLHYTPHFATLTETGQANFSRLSDAIAEFIDNALSACSMNPGSRDISVSFFLGSSNDTNEITIRDNGQGEERDQAPSDTELAESKPGQFLGKYGVGAMQAGFFIGSRIELHTKSSGDDYVLQFAMDERIYRERQARGEDVYSDPIVVRRPGIFVYTDGGKRSLHRSHFLEEERTMNQFTCITLRLRERFVEETSKTGFVQRVVNELSHIYHYFLHDDDCPENVKNSGRYAKKRKGSTRQSPTLDREIVTSSSTLKIQIEVWKGDEKTPSTSVNLSDVDADLASRRVGVNGMAKDMFTFAFKVRNPSEKRHQEWLNCIGACYYFPTVSGRETRPAEEKETTNDEYYLTDDDMFDPEFEVYWQKRLVPQSHVRRLPFFPTGSISREDRDALGPWQQRIGTTLHFPYHCPTSNNKLKILLGPDLTDYLCDRETALFNGKKIASEFKSWLARCHSLYDDVVTFDNPLTPPQQSEQHNTGGIALWGKCSFDASNCVLCTGDRVKLITRPVIFGIIVRFETEGVDAQGRATHSGARVVVCRHPQEIFGQSDEQYHPLTRIDTLDSMVLEELWNEYMDKTTPLLPTSLDIYSYKAGGRPVGKELTFSYEDWVSWSPFQVQIMDGSNPPKVVTKFPVTKEALSVYLEIREGSTSSGKSIAKFKLGDFSSKNNNSILFKKIKALSVPGSYNARFWISPKGGLEKRVLVRVMPAEPATLSIVWTDEKQEELVYSLPSSSKTEEEEIGGGGIPIPAFEISLKDGKRNECPIDFLKSITLNCGTETEREHLRITLSDNNNTTGSGGGGGDGTNNGDKNLSKLCLESSAATETLVGQEFSDGQWVLHPLCQGILAKLRRKSDEVASISPSSVEISVQFIATLKSEVLLSASKHLFIGPGHPAGICLMDGSTGTTTPPLLRVSPFPVVTVEDGYMLPPIFTVLVDDNGNPTVPGRTETFVVKVFSDEPENVVVFGGGPSTITPPPPPPHYTTTTSVGVVSDNGVVEFEGIFVASVNDGPITSTVPHETTLLIQLFEQQHYQRKKNSRKSISKTSSSNGSSLTSIQEKRVGGPLKLRVILKPGTPINLSIPQECLPEGTREVGTIVKGLQIKFVGRDVEECPTPHRIHAIVQEMSVSWNTSWKWTPVDLPASAVSEGGEDNSNLLLVHLPDLEIPTRLKERDKIYGSTSNNWQCPFQIKANTKSGKDITCEFHIEVTAGNAVAWGRSSNSIPIHESPVIFLGGRRDVGSMIGPITAVDKYGNPSINLSHDEPSPHDMKINLDFSTHLNQEVNNESQRRQDACVKPPYFCPPCPVLEKVGRFTYVLPDGVIAFRGEGHSLDGHIFVSSVNNEVDLKPLRIPAKFVGGSLASLSVKAPSIGIQEWTVGGDDCSLTGTVHVNMNIEDFSVRGLDESGDVYGRMYDEDHQKIRVTIRNENDAAAEIISCSSLVLDENGEGIVEAFNVGCHFASEHFVVEVYPDGECGNTTVSPLLVHCHVVRSNFVTSLYIAAVHDDFSNVDKCIADFKQGDVNFIHLYTEGLSIGNMGTSISCDAPLPNLAVWCETEDSLPFIPKLDSLEFKLQYDDKSLNPIPLEDAYYCSEEDSASTTTRNISDMALLLKAKAGFEPAFMGCITIGCLYNENRPPIVDLLEKAKKPRITHIETDFELTINVSPGALASLSPHSNSISKLENITCGNRGGDDETALSERSLASGPIYFTGLDAYGNETSVHVPILAFITGRTGCAAPPPRLEGSDILGYLFSEECDAQSISISNSTNRKMKKTARKTQYRSKRCSPSKTNDNMIYHRFNTLRIEEGSCQTPGCYELVVKCQDGGDGGVAAEVQPWVTQIRFVDDSTRIEHLRALEEQLQHIEELLEQALESEAEATVNAEEARQRLDNYIESNGGYLPHLDTLKTTDLSDLASSRELMNEFAEEASNTRKELEDMSSTYSPRPAVHPPKMEYEANALRLEGCLGHVVKLGFVSENNLARLLSWAVQSRLKAVLLETKEEQSRTARRGLATYSMDTIRPFQVKRRDKSASAGFTTAARSRESVEAQCIPLPQVDTEGFIGYAVNLIALPREAEHLRDTLFWAIYGNLCVFETLEQMSNYAQRLKSRNKTAVSMISLDGYRRDSTGFIDGNKNAILEPSKALSYVYGAPRDTPERSVMKQRLDSLEELLPHLENVVSSNDRVIHATDKILTRGESIASLQQDIDSLRKEISTASLALGEEEPSPGCSGDEEETNMEIIDGIRNHKKARMMANSSTTTDVQKSSGKKRGIPQKKRSKKRISR